MEKSVMLSGKKALVLGVANERVYCVGDCQKI